RPPRHAVYERMMSSAEICLPTERSRPYIRTVVSGRVANDQAPWFPWEMIFMTRFRCRPALGTLLAILCLPAVTVHADTFSALAFENATVWPSGPRPGASGVNFFDVEGINNNSFAAYGVADFSLSDLLN